MSVEFVNLHSHTSLGSMLDALNNVGALFEKVKSFGQQAIAITDHGTMAAHFDAYKASLATGYSSYQGASFILLTPMKRMVQNQKSANIWFYWQRTTMVTRIC